MPRLTTYRAYIISSEGDIFSFRTFEAGSDNEAIDKAKVMPNSHGIDLWKGTQYLGSFPPRGP